MLIILSISGLIANKIYQGSSENQGAWGSAGEILVVAKQASLEEFVEQIEAIGTAQGNESISITAKVTESVQKVNFEDGDYVEKGRILVHLTNAEETALLSEAQATLDEASQQYKRVSNLMSQNLASQTQLDEENARQQTAQARLEAIVARMDDRLIRAPFSGVLGFRNVSEGSLITTNTIITTLDDISRIKLDFTVPEIYLSALHIGQDVFAISDAYPEHQFEGKVATISSRVDPITRSVVVRAIIPNQEKLLHPGMLMKVNLIRSRETVTAIPEESLFPIADKQFVYRVKDDNTVERVAVEIGRRRPGLVEILSDFPVGTTVVTEGVIRIRPGSKVKLKQ
jgi:membrane fusion protein (multidrug efflux system)